MAGSIIKIKKSHMNIKKMVISAATTALMFGSMVVPALAATPLWDVSGSWVVAFEYLGPVYAHDMTLVQAPDGSLTGSGGHPAGGPHVYTWVLTSGSVSGNTIDFLADYTATADAVTPQTTMHVVGTIAPDGTMSGTWTDNYQGGSRGGTWSSTSGIATLIGFVPTSKDECKKGGWMTMVDSEGNSFKNQGDCVSFVATGGKNLGAGN